MTTQPKKARTATVSYILIGARLQRMGNSPSKFLDDRYASRADAMKALIQLCASDQWEGYKVTIRVRLPYSYRSPFRATVGRCATCQRQTQHVDGWCTADHF